MWTTGIISTCHKPKHYDGDVQIRVVPVQVECNSSEVAQRGVQLIKKGEGESNAWSWLFVSKVKGIRFRAIGIEAMRMKEREDQKLVCSLL